MEKEKEVIQDAEDRSLSEKDIEKIFEAWDFKNAIRTVFDGGREIVRAASESDEFGTILLHIVPWRVEADAWLGGLSPSNKEVKEFGYYDRAVGRKEYSFCEALNEKGHHRVIGLHDSAPVDLRAELMMRFAYLQRLTHASAWSSAAVKKERAKCLPQYGYSTHKGAISFYVCYQGVTLMHFSLGIAGFWDDDCEYEYVCKVAKNLWSYLKQTAEQRCYLQYPQGLGVANVCTTEGMKKNLENL